MSQEKIFPNGLVYKEPRPNAPAWVKASLSFKVADFIAFLQKHQTNSGWVNVDVKESKGGKLYCELNDYKPKRPDSLDEPAERPAQEPKKASTTDAVEYPIDDINPDDIPF